MRTQIIAVLAVLGATALIIFTALASGSSGGTAVATEPTVRTTGTAAVTGTAPAVTRTVAVTGTAPAVTRTVGVTRTAAVTRTVVVTATAPADGEGCTPGYWKTDQHQDSWVATGYSPGQTLESVFDVPDSYGLDNVTLRDALSLSGGPTTADKAALLLHHAVAALLNSAHPDIDYPWLTADVISETNDALASGSKGEMQTLKNVFDADNNQDCVLN